MDNVHVFLREICGALASGKMFPVEHPQFRMVLLKAFTTLNGILSNQKELILGVVEEELIYGNEVLFELSTLLKSFITALQQKGIEKIHFMQGIQDEELAKFISFLCSKKEVSGNLQDYFSALGIHHIKVSKLTTPLEERKKEFVSEVQVYENTMKELTGQFEKIVQAKMTSGYYMNLKFIIFSILENFAGHYGEFALLFEDKKFNKGFAHGFNTAMLSIQLAQGLGFQQEEILEVGIAALVHDIGNIGVRKDKENTGTLSGEPGTVIPDDAIAGMHTLLKYEDFLGNLPFIVAGECHLKQDDNIIMGGVISLRPHIVSQIVGISAYYDDFHIRENKKEGYSPLMIYEDMHHNQEHLWPSTLFAEFFRCLGVWPTGSVVQLSDKSIAVIREQNRRDIFSPNVEVVHPEGNKGFLDLKKSEVTINKYLHPMGAGEPYLKFI